MGLPRSGSSLLSHVLSQATDWYVFDDLYTARHAKGLGADFDSPLTPSQFEEMLHFLGWQIRARLLHTEYAKPACTIDEVEPMNDAIRACFKDSLPSWPRLQEEWMARLALRAGATRWGWKTPGAFRYLDKLKRVYPGLKVIYLMRRPEKALASYKHMDPSNKDGNPAQFHPVAYAIYWRMAGRSWQQAAQAGDDSTAFVTFEDLTADVAKTAKRLGTFLDSPLDSVTLPEKANSYFQGGVAKVGARQGLTGLEMRILTWIAGVERDHLFPNSPMDMPPLRGGDIVDFVKCSFVFTGYRLGLVFKRIRRRFFSPAS